MSSLTMTPLRLFALRYAAGMGGSFPSYSVARALELAGLIRWTGWVKGVHSSAEKVGFMGLGWEVTDEGRKVLGLTEGFGG